MMVGWDNVAGGQLASLPEFRKQFGVHQADDSYLLPVHILSAWQSIGPACDIVAALIAAPFLEKYGRKPQIAVASVLSVAGVLLQQLATEWRMHLAGRAVNGELRERRIGYSDRSCAAVDQHDRGGTRNDVYDISSMDRRDVQTRAARFLSVLVQYQYRARPVSHVRLCCVHSKSLLLIDLGFSFPMAPVSSKASGNGGRSWSLCTSFHVSRLNLSQRCPQS